MLIPAPTSGTSPWQLNGVAEYSGSPTSQTGGTGNLNVCPLSGGNGSAVYTGGTISPALINGTTGVYSFTTYQGNGSGADGICIAWLDPSTCSTSSVGTGPGADVGFITIGGNSAAFMMHKWTGNCEWVLSNGSVQKTISDGNLTGTHAWKITLTRTGFDTVTAVIVKDGTPYVTWTGLTCLDSAYLAFTGATGGANDDHIISSVNIGAQTSFALDGDYENAVLTDGPTHYWPLSETSGPGAYDVIVDTADPINNGITQGKVGPFPSELCDTSYLFDPGGLSAGVIPASAPLVGTGSFSVECWFNQDNGSARQALFTVGNNNTYQGFYFYTQSGNIHTDFANVGAGSGGTVVNGQWYHAAATYNTTGGVLTVYLNGSQIYTNSGFSANIQNNDVTGIGYTSATAGPFRGLMAQVATYSSVLSSTRVAAHYAAGTAILPFSLGAGTGPFGPQGSGPGLARFGRPRFLGDTTLPLLMQGIPALTQAFGRRELLMSEYVRTGHAAFAAGIGYINPPVLVEAGPAFAQVNGSRPQVWAYGQSAFASASALPGKTTWLAVRAVPALSGVFGVAAGIQAAAHSAFAQGFGVVASTLIWPPTGTTTTTTTTTTTVHTGNGGGSFKIPSWRWQMVDPTGVISSYTWEINPISGGFPSPQKQITQTPTTAPSGPVLLQEGRQQVASSQVTGTFLSESQHLALNSWFNLRRPFYLIDDLGNRWTIYITQYQPGRRRSRNFPWRVDYTLTYQVLDVLYAPNPGVGYSFAGAGG